MRGVIAFGVGAYRTVSMHVSAGTLQARKSAHTLDPEREVGQRLKFMCSLIILDKLDAVSVSTPQKG